MAVMWRAMVLAGMVLAGARKLWAQEVAEKLDRPVTGFAVRGEPLEKAAAAFGKMVGVEIRVDKRRLGSVAEAKVSVRGDGKTGWDVLTAMVGQASPDHAAAFGVRDGAVVITLNREDTGVFDIRDLLAPAEKQGALARDGAVNAIVGRVVEKVAPASWEEEHFAEIREYQGRLHVRQKLEQLTQVERLLREVRAAGGVAADMPTAALVLQEGDESEGVEGKLASQKVSLAYEGSLEMAGRKLSDAAGVSILLKWKELATVGISRTDAVKVDAKEEAAGKVLGDLLAQVKGAKGKVGFAVKEGVVEVSTVEELESPAHQTVEVYDVRDLLAAPGEAMAAGAARQRMAAFVEALQAAVKPGGWEKGKGGTIRELNGQLVVRQMPEGQRAIRNYLQLQRRARNVQVTVEARLLEVSPEVLKGVREMAPFDRHVPKAEGMPEGYSVVDELDLARFLKTVTEDAATRTTTSPRLTLFLGQESLTRTGGEEKNVVVGWRKKPEGGDDPVIDTVYSGVELGVMPHLSVDGGQIEMDVDLLVKRISGKATPPTVEAGVAKAGTTQTVTSARIAGTFAWSEGWTLLALGPEAPGKRLYVLALRGRLMLPRVKDYPLVAEEGAGSVHVVK
jgi:hypothetical protein